jgi:hypothetical protein
MSSAYSLLAFAALLAFGAGSFFLRVFADSALGVLACA